MLILICYCLIALLATTIGALAGLGGGVIMKPLFDLLNVHSAKEIGLYSCLAVFTMSIVSISRQLKNGFKFNKQITLLISAGSIVGGILGETIFKIATSSLNDYQVKMIQALLLGITLIMIIIYTKYKNKIKHYHITNLVIIFLAGAFLGTVSIFLGIGGGPINLAVMMILFSFDIKEASVYSISTIFFSQLSKIVNSISDQSLFSIDFYLAGFLCVFAVLGGMIGTQLQIKLTNDKIQKIYNVLLIVLLLLSLYNFITNAIS